MSDNIDQECLQFEYEIMVYSSFYNRELEYLLRQKLFDYDENDIDSKREKIIIYDALKILKNLNTIQFNLFQNSYIKKTLSKFKSQAIFFPNLQSLELIFGNYSAIGSEDFYTLGDFISNLKNLTKLSISFGNLQNQKLNYQFKDLFQSIEINQLKKIISFKLIVGQIQCGFEGIQSICLFIQNLSNLNQLELYIGPGNKISSLGAIHLGQTIQKLIKLNNLSLEILDQNLLMQDGLLALIKGIQNIETIEKLVLDIFRKEELQGEILSEVRKSFEKLSHLKSLKYSVRGQNISYQGGIEIAKSISNLEELQELEFDCIGDVIGKFHEQIINNQIFSGLNSLRKIVFKIEDDQSKSVQVGISKILQKLVTTLQQLSTFELIIQKNTYFSLNQFSMQDNYIGQLINLTNLNIDIQPTINGNCLRNLTKELSQLKQLSHLSLNLTIYIENDQNIKQLIQIFSQFDKLKSLKFQLVLSVYIIYQDEDYQKVFDEIQATFLRSVQKLKRLYSLQLKINNQLARNILLIKKKLRRLVKYQKN